LPELPALPIAKIERLLTQLSFNPGDFGNHGNFGNCFKLALAKIRQTLTFGKTELDFVDSTSAR
jgi:hypothetical protein